MSAAHSGYRSKSRRTSSSCAGVASMTICSVARSAIRDSGRRTVALHDREVVPEDDAVTEQDGHGEDGDHQPPYPGSLVLVTTDEAGVRSVAAIDEGENGRKLQANHQAEPLHGAVRLLALRRRSPGCKGAGARR